MVPLTDVGKLGRRESFQGQWVCFLSDVLSRRPPQGSIWKRLCGSGKTKIKLPDGLGLNPWCDGCGTGDRRSKQRAQGRQVTNGTKDRMARNTATESPGRGREESGGKKDGPG